MDGELGREYLDVCGLEFRKLRSQAEKALEQASDESFFAPPGEGGNSMAVLVKHLAGNIRSRWADFLTTDGEKPERDRDAEFELNGPADTRDALMAAWAASWELLSRELAALGPDDLLRKIRIRGQPHTVVAAIQRQLTHTAGHVGQIVLLAKWSAGESWQTLSVPRGRSREFTAAMKQSFAGENADASSGNG